jgi:hypothetical protein
VARDQGRVERDPAQLLVQLDARHVPERQLEEFIAAAVEQCDAIDDFVPYGEGSA